MLIIEIALITDQRLYGQYHETLDKVLTKSTGIIDDKLALTMYEAIPAKILAGVTVIKFYKLNVDTPVELPPENGNNELIVNGDGEFD